MPTNANTFNSRVTSEALEEKFRQVFPAQGGAELVQDLFASGVIQPVVDFSSVAEGSVLAPNLQTAWDFATSFVTRGSTGTTALTSTPGFWQVDLTSAFHTSTGGGEQAFIRISDGLGTKTVWGLQNTATNTTTFQNTVGRFVVYLRSGDTLQLVVTGSAETSVWYRQIADVNGTLVNPLGFVFT